MVEALAVPVTPDKPRLRGWLHLGMTPSWLSVA